MDGWQSKTEQIRVEDVQEVRLAKPFFPPGIKQYIDINLE